MSRASGALGLPRAERLRRAAAFQAVFQHGKRFERRAFVVLWHRAPGDRKVGFTVSRQVRTAVRRNRLRRRLREAYRRAPRSLPPGVSAVFVGRPACLVAGFAELLEEMAEAVMAVAGRSREEGPESRPPRSDS